MSCYHTCELPANVNNVWATISDFHNLDWAKGVIESLQVVGDKNGHQTGARRLLNGAITETLVNVDNNEHSFTYSIDDGPAVLAKETLQGYLGKVRLSEIDDTHSKIEWSSDWQGAEGDVKAFCDPIYDALLGALKSHFSHH